MVVSVEKLPVISGLWQEHKEEFLAMRHHDPLE